VRVTLQACLRCVSQTPNHFFLSGVDVGDSWPALSPVFPPALPHLVGLWIDVRVDAAPPAHSAPVLASLVSGR
jgi:hypothetical protein